MKTDADIIKSYLVSLGATVDVGSFANMDKIMSTSESFVRKSLGRQAGEFVSYQIAATGALASIGLGVMGYIAHLANLDQKQKQLAMQNGMAIGQYRAMSNSLDILGWSMEDVWNGTAQMQRQFKDLYNDQKQMNSMLGPDYEHQMEQVRETIFQLQRLELKAQNFGMLFASDLLKHMGFGEDGITGQLARLNDYIMEKMPEWSEEISGDFVPTLHEIWDVLKETGVLVWDIAGAFTNFVGILSGDTSIEGETTNLHQFAKAIEHVIHWIAELLKVIIAGEHGLVGFSEAVGHGLKSAFDMATGDMSGAQAEHDLSRSAAMRAYGAANDFAGVGSTPQASTPSSTLKSFMDSSGVPDDILHRQMMTESGGRDVTNRKSGAAGYWQIMPEVARKAGVDPHNLEQSTGWAKGEMARLSKHYGGNIDLALAAYNMGQGKLDSYMATGHYMASSGRMASQIPDETKNYVRRISGHDLVVQVHIGTVHSGTPAAVEEAARRGAQRAIDENNVRQMAEMNGAYQ